ncbi:MAG: amidophosphoribosyltransferase [Desulfarculales bacterium]|nr:amidophosphoribosyltransferase [Desulfarculales bacterium]
MDYNYEGPGENCGVFGVFGNRQASLLTYYGLYALQHRGQESVGIVVSDGSRLYDKRAMGLVSDVFQPGDFEQLPGSLACGHVRYSTTGASSLANVQPLVVHFSNSNFCLAHNGNLTNAAKVRRDLEQKGSIFQSSSDTEIVTHLLARNFRHGLEQAMINSLREIKGAYSFILMTNDTLVAARDRHGFRPLCLGKLDDAYILASETCALDLVDAVYVREIDPGEILFIDKNGMRSLKPFPPLEHRHCIFEFVYFARPDSNVFGHNVYMIRHQFGKVLAGENPRLRADFVMPFPDSGNYAAIGFSQESGIPLEMAMIRNHYVGRSFIQPTQDLRDFAVKIKLNPVSQLIKGKKIIVVDDSIVRGTTALNRVKGLRRAGAQEVHMLVASPPCVSPCYYGVDFARREQLIASAHTTEEIKNILELDSLNYLSIEGMLSCMAEKQRDFCLACFNSVYPVKCAD